MNAHWKTVGVGESRGGRAQSGVKTQRSVALGRDCWGWKAGAQKGVEGEKLEEDEVAGKAIKCKEPASGVFFPFKCAKI